MCEWDDTYLQLISECTFDTVSAQPSICQASSRASFRFSRFLEKLNTTDED